MLTLRIFLSSPGDVAEERRLAVDTMRALEDGPLLRERINLQVVAWDDPAASAPLDARETPQASVNRWAGRPADCDLTIVILWSRLGTPLPASLTRADGSRFASGTVWEVEDAIAADRPVFVYRRTEKPRIELDDADFEAKRAQYDAVRRWFDALRERDGAWRSGVNEYAGPAQFQPLLRTHLEAFIGRALAASGAAAPRDAAAAAAAPPSVPPSARPAGRAAPAVVQTARAAPRWLLPAAAAALLGVAAVAWLLRPGAAPEGGQGAPPVTDVAAPAGAAPSPQTAARAQTQAPAPLRAVPAALPQVRLAGPAELTFSKTRKSTYSVLALTPETGGSDGWRLRIRVRLTTDANSGGMNFWDSSFRLLVDGVPRAPDSNLNEIVDSAASKDGDITFDVPYGTQTLALRVHHYAEAAELPLAFSGAPPAAVAPAGAPAGPRTLVLAAAPQVVFTKPSPATFTVLRVSTEVRRSGVYGVRARIRLTLAASAVAENFGDDQFRLLVDGVARAPDSQLNLVVEGGAARDADVTFEVPDAATSLVLRIVHRGQATADLPLRLEAMK